MARDQLKAALIQNGFGEDTEAYKTAMADHEYIRGAQEEALQKQQPSLGQVGFGALINGGVAGLSRLGGADHAGAMKDVQYWDPLKRLGDLNAQAAKMGMEADMQGLGAIQGARKQRSINEILNPTVKNGVAQGAVTDPSQIAGPNAQAQEARLGGAGVQGMPGSPSGPSAGPPTPAGPPPPAAGPSSLPAQQSSGGGGYKPTYSQQQIAGISALDPDLGKRLQDANAFGLDVSKHDLEQAKFIIDSQDKSMDNSRAERQLAFDQDKHALENDPNHKAEMAEAGARGEAAGKTKAEEQKMNNAASAVGQMVDELEQIADDPNISGAIGPVDQFGVVQGVQGSLGAKSYEIASKIDMLTRGLELKMTRLLMQGQGQITEGERAIVRDHIGNLRAAKDANDYRNRAQMLREVISMQFGKDLPSNMTPAQKEFAAKLQAARQADPRAVDPNSVVADEQAYDADRAKTAAGNAKQQTPGGVTNTQVKPGGRYVWDPSKGITAHPDDAAAAPAQPADTGAAGVSGSIHQSRQPLGHDRSGRPIYDRSAERRTGFDRSGNRIEGR